MWSFCWDLFGGGLEHYYWNKFPKNGVTKTTGIQLSAVRVRSWKVSPWAQSKVSTAVVVATFLFFRGTQHTYLFIRDRKTTTDKSTNTTAVQFGDPKSFIGITYKNMSEELHYSRNDS